MSLFLQGSHLFSVTAFETGLAKDAVELDLVEDEPVALMLNAGGWAGKAGYRMTLDADAPRQYTLH